MESPSKTASKNTTRKLNSAERKRIRSWVKETFKNLPSFTPQPSQKAVRAALNMMARNTMARNKRGGGTRRRRRH
jgi:hypothetical protein